PPARADLRPRSGRPGASWPRRARGRLDPRINLLAACPDMTTLGRAVQNLARSGPVLREASASGNLRVLASLLGPAYRGLVMQEARGAQSTSMQAEHRAIFDWSYLRERPQLARLYEA